MTDRGWTRRGFLETTVAALGAMSLTRVAGATQRKPASPPFKISLAQWSLHRTLGKKEIDHLDFARIAKRDFGIEAIEYVNTFFKDKARDPAYLAEMNLRAKDEGVYQHLIMCDGEGQLGIRTARSASGRLRIIASGLTPRRHSGA